MNDGDRQLDFEMLPGCRMGKPGTIRDILRVYILERAGDLNVQEISDAKETP